MSVIRLLFPDAQFGGNAVTDAIQFAILGLGAGSAYTLLALGIVLIYRGSGIVNFAHGGIAMFSAYFCFLSLVGERGWAIGAAIPVAVVAGGLLGWLFQNAVLRLMRNTAPLVRLVATLGFLIVLQGLAAKQLWDNQFHQVDQFLPNEVHTLNEWFGIGGELGAVVVQEDRLILLGIAILLTALLWAFTRYTRVGLAITGSAENERSAASLGWSPGMLATLTWSIGGALAGFAGILLAPNAGLSISLFSIVVTVAALAVALIAGFESFPLVLVGGLGLGIAESEVLRYSGDISTWLQDTFGIENGATGLQRAIPFLVIVVVLVVHGKALPLRSHVLDQLPDIGTGVITRWFLVVGVGVLIALNTFVFDAELSTAMYTSLIVGIFVLSMVALTGFAGQLSLGQYAIGGLGALFAARMVASEGWPVELAFLGGVAFAMAAGLVFAIPALRTRGVNLAVVTLGLGYAVQQMIFANAYYTGEIGSVTPIGKTKVFGWDVSSAEHPERYFLVCLAFFVLASVMVANLRRSRSGRRLIAVRNNERAAASLGISVFTAKLYAFAVAAAIAAFAGILLAFRDTTVTYERFDAFLSINTVGNAVAGGVGWVFGAVFGAQLAPGGIGSWLLDLVDLGEWVIVFGGVILIVILIANPNGIASVVFKQEHGPLAHLRRKLRHTPRREELPVVTPERVSPRALQISDLSVHFGGVVAVDHVSFDVEPGLVVGLIGPNGAGKTTVIDAITGYVRPANGSVQLDGVAMRGRGWSPSRRARAGVRRSFQSLELFDDISVAENLHAGSGERSALSGFTDLFWPGRHPLPATAVAAVQEFELEPYLDRLPTELPYGRRRLVGIAHAMASAPSVLLLDEPAAGLDEHETGELGRLVQRLARERGIAVMLIEHDMSLVLEICDRVVVLDFGRKIAEGAPAQIRTDPAVIAAYLGGATPETENAPR